MLWLPVILATCSPAPSGGGGGSNSGGTLTGQLLYFSGRPAPEWTLSEGETAELAGRLEGLTAMTAPAEFPRFGPIGYYVLNDDGIAGLPDSVLVQDGAVEVKSGDTYSYYSDDKGLEQALRESAQADGVFAELGRDASAQKGRP